MSRQHPRGGLIVARRRTWDAALHEALRRREVCVHRFGPGEPHRWVFTVRRLPGRDPRRWWAITFDPKQVRP